MNAEYFKDLKFINELLNSSSEPEVIIDRDAGVYPMVGPGLAYDQMITGDWIPHRVKTTEEDIDGSSMF